MAHAGEKIGFGPAVRLRFFQSQPHLSGPQPEVKIKAYQKYGQHQKQKYYRDCQLGIGGNNAGQRDMRLPNGNHVRTADCFFFGFRQIVDSLIQNGKQRRVHRLGNRKADLSVVNWQAHLNHVGEIFRSNDIFYMGAYPIEEINLSLVDIF